MSDWIKTCDKMPEVSQHILLFPCCGRVTEGYLHETYSKKIKVFRSSDGLKVYGTVTHWMSLPNPPQIEL